MKSFNMKKLIFLILTLAVAWPATAQVIKCKYAENTIDSFTGHRIIETKFTSVGKLEGTNDDVQMTIRKVDSVYFITIGTKLEKCVGTMNSELWFKNNVGTIYKSKHMGEVNCGERIYLGYGVWSYVSSSIRIKLDEETKPVLTEPITMFRINIDQGYLNVNTTMPMIIKQLCDCVNYAPAPK